jgi:hypothetical protein
MPELILIKSPNFKLTDVTANEVISDLTSEIAYLIREMTNDLMKRDGLNMRIADNEKRLVRLKEKFDAEITQSGR